MYLRPSYSQRGFTLIELSIVLVIIGFIVGSVLVGQDLIRAAALRQQIKQIQDYQMAVTTFRVKYDALPGDISGPKAASFGLRTGANATETQCSNNGVLQSNAYSWCAGGALNASLISGEVLVFWNDLTAAKLIQDSFFLADFSYPLPGQIQGSIASYYFPKSKIRDTVYVYVWSDTKKNYFGLANITADYIRTDAWLISTWRGAALTTKEAYNMDVKVDDGYPTSGTMTTSFSGYNHITSYEFWTAGDFMYDLTTPIAITSTGSPYFAGFADTCFDNNGDTSQPYHYTISSKVMSPLCRVSFEIK